MCCIRLEFKSKTQRFLMKTDTIPTDISTSGTDEHVKMYTRTSKVTAEREKQFNQLNLNTAAKHYDTGSLFV